jgi:hypothetical protein
MKWWWPFGFIWALPGTLIGLLVSLLCGPTKVRLQAGVLVLSVKRCIPAMAIAQTWGVVILMTPAGDRPVVFTHESCHVRQWMALGVFFMPAYCIASLIAWARGRNYYRDNYFEAQAYAAETPKT